MELKLIVLAGAKQGLEIPLKKDTFLIGRAKECALRAGSEAISRQHCAITRTASGWTAKDLGSRNGTYVNDERISAEVPLKVGDELRVGPLKFRIAPVVATASNAAPGATPTAAEKSRKQPPVRNVADVVQRTIDKADDDTTEDDISRWLLGIVDTKGKETLKETRAIRLEETTLSRPVISGEKATVEDVSDSLPLAEDSDASLAVDPPDENGKSGGWNIFKRSKAGSSGKRKPGKLPARPDAQSKDSREAAADILREMTRRR